MKLIHSSFEILEHKPGLEGIYEAIELAGRTCYKSERPEGKTAKDFVDMLIKRGHLSPLEHGTVYLMIPITTNHSGFSITKYQDNPYSKVVETSGLLFKDEYGDPCDMWCITSNLRVLYENDLMEDLENYLCEPTEHHERRVGVKVNCSIGISREWNRHRTFSVCEQSTRYCNYSKDRFGNELTFVIPSWLDIPEERYYYEDQNPFLTAGGNVEEYGYDDAPNVWFTNGSSFKEAKRNTTLDDFFKALHHASEAYFDLLANHIPQQARDVLPLATATEVVYTGFISDWEHFFELRTVPGVHPDMLALAIPLKEEFIKKGYIK